MLSLIKRYYHTLKFLHWTQIKYQLIYRLWSPNKKSTGKGVLPSKKEKIILLNSIPSNASWLGNNTFDFLNIKHRFKNGIDWNYQKYGKLWTYNLTYFEYLSQTDLSKEEGRLLIHDFIKKQQHIQDGMESFPISLRCIFWIKFLVQHQIQDEEIDRSLYAQFRILSKQPEYHLLGNHLLENGFSLLFGAYYFDDERLLKQARQILTQQLSEQILGDGAHFELSPMYHQIILFRLLDSINVLQNNKKGLDQMLLRLMREKAALMLGWIEQMTFKNGTIPMVNDSTNNIAPDTKSILKYGLRLGIKPNRKTLRESGYRKIEMPNYELLIDVGAIGPDYIPGHAHSDTFNFILHHQGLPLLVDMGISTYEKNTRRNLERSTASHNTVVINELEQSEVWGGFRVARRAKIIRLEESDHQVRTAHDGYHRIKCEHQRGFFFEKQTLTINDKILGDGQGTAFFHFHSSVNPEIEGHNIKGTFGAIGFNGCSSIRLAPYSLAVGFNQTQPATKAIVTFRTELCTKITLT